MLPVCASWGPQIPGGLAVKEGTQRVGSCSRNVHSPRREQPDATLGRVTHQASNSGPHPPSV